MMIRSVTTMWQNKNKQVRSAILGTLAALIVMGIAVGTAMAANPLYPTAYVFYKNDSTGKAAGDLTTPNAFARAYSYRTDVDGQFSTTDADPVPGRITVQPEFGDPAVTAWDVGSSAWNNPVPTAGNIPTIVLETRNGLNGWTGESWVGSAKATLTLSMIANLQIDYRDVVMERIPTPQLQSSSSSSIIVGWQGLWDNSTAASGGAGPGLVTGYTVYRNVNGGAYSAVGSVSQYAGATVSYTDTDVNLSDTYRYKIGVRYEWGAHTPNYYEPAAQSQESAAITATPPQPTRIGFLSSAPTFAAGNKSAVLTIEARDANGNPANVTSDTTVALTSDSTGANKKFYSVSAGSCTDTVITSVDIATGTSTAQLCYYDEKAGSWTLTADKSTPADPDWLAGTLAATVTSSDTLGSIDLALANAQKNRVAFTGTNTLTALDNFGNTMTTFSAASNNVTFTVAPGTASVAGLNGSGSAQLTLGSDVTSGVVNLTNRLQLVGQSGSYTVTATTADGKSDTASVTLGGGVLHHFDFSLTDPQRIDTAFTGTNTLTAKDADGNTITDFDAQSTNVTITESASAGTVSGLGASSNNVLNQAGSFTNGVANLSGAMKYVGTATQHSFRATAGSVNSISSPISFTVGPFAKLAVNLNNNQPNAQPFTTATVTAQDAGGNTVTDFDASADNVTVTVNSGSVTGGSLTQANSFVNGVASLAGQLTYTGQAGSRTFTATSASGKTGNQTVTIVAGTRTSVKIVNGSSSAATEVTTSTLTADQTLPLYAAGYDVSNNWTGLVSGSWTSGGTLAPAVSASATNSITFAPTTAPASGIISFTDGTLNDSTGTITVNPGNANRLVVTAPATAIAGQSFLVTITAVDADGNTVTGYIGSQTVAFSGPGNAPDGTTPTYPTNATFSGGVATASVTLVKSETIKLTVTRGALTGQSDFITVGGAAANSLVVSAPATATAGQSFAATITAYDDFGNVDTGYDGSKSVAFANPGNAPDGTTPGYPSSVEFTDGVGSATVTLYKKEATTLKATEGARTGTSGTILVGAASADRIVKVSGDSQTGPVAQALPLPLVVQVFDAYDNQKDGYNVNFVVTTGGGSVNASPVATAADGTAQVTWTLGSSPGPDNNALEARATGAAGSPIGFTASANGNGFVITIPANVTAGVAFSPSVKLVDSDGNTVTSYNGVKTVIFSGPSNGPDGTAPTYPVTVTFVDGVAQPAPQITLVAAETTTLTLAEGSLTGTSLPFTVSVGDPAKLAITTPPQQLALNAVSEPITVCIQDRYGNAVITSQERTLNLSATSGGGRFSESSDGPWDSYQAKLGIGLNCTTIYYKDSYAGSKMLTVASSGLSEATQQISISPSGGDTGTGDTPDGGGGGHTVVNHETTRTVYVYADKPSQQATAPGDDVVAVPLPTSAFPVIKTPRANSLVAPLDGKIVVTGTAQANKVIRLKTEQGTPLGSATSDALGRWSMYIDRDTIQGDRVSIIAEHADGWVKSASVGFIIKSRTFTERVISFLTP